MSDRNLFAPAQEQPQRALTNAVSAIDQLQGWHLSFLIDLSKAQDAYLTAQWFITHRPEGHDQLRSMYVRKARTLLREVMRSDHQYFLLSQQEQKSIEGIPLNTFAPLWKSTRLTSTATSILSALFVFMDYQGESPYIKSLDSHIIALVSYMEHGLIDCAPRYKSHAIQAEQPEVSTNRGLWNSLPK